VIGYRTVLAGGLRGEREGCQASSSGRTDACLVDTRIMVYHSGNEEAESVGNRSSMAAPGAGCARTVRSLRHTYALVKGCASL